VLSLIVFCPDQPCEHALSVPGIIGVAKKIQAVPGYATLPIPSKKSYRPSIQTPLCALVFPQLLIGLLGEGCEPVILGNRRP